MEELKQKWNDIKESIRIEYEVPDISYKTWIDPLTLGDIKDNTVYIVTPKELAQSIFIINKKFYTPFKVSINEALGKSYNDQLEISFISEDELNKSNKPKEEASYNKVYKYEQSNLNQKYTFDTFVVGSNNRLAHASAVAVSENPGEIYNPLFIYGGVGLGKTHLMQAIGHYIIDQNPDANVLYTTSEQFTNEVIENVRNGTSPEKTKKFKEKYRSLDVLLIDDIQFIIGKNSTQEEFFHTFNQLYEQKKQIIITSDKPPKDMDVLEERFTSRFGWGLIVDIQFPDYETRMAILQKKIEAESLDIDNEVLTYIANNVKSNIRELEGALKKVDALSRLEKRTIDINLAKEALKDVVSPNSPSKITIDEIINVVCDHYSVKKEDIISSKRNKELVRPRHIIMYLGRFLTAGTYNEIAAVLGGRDHTTVIHGERVITDLIENDEATRRTIETIINKIKSF